MAAEGDTWPLLAALADRADAETDGSKGVRFSFRWDLGNSRFVMIDSRNGRILDGGAHLMLGESEFGWIEEQVRDRSSGPVDHLVLGTSLPWLLPHAIGDLQSINQIAAARPGWRGRLGEAIRQLGDLEHWQAFRSSFDRLTRMITAAATGSGRAGEHQRALRRRPPQLRGTGRPAGARRRPGSGCCGRPPAHLLPGAQRRRLVHPAGVPARLVAHDRAGDAVVGRRAGVPPLEVSWHKLTGPLFGNTVATLDLDGRHAQVTFLQPRSAGSMTEVARLVLADGPRAAGDSGAAALARGCNPAVIDRSSPSRVRAARGG